MVFGLEITVPQILSLGGARVHMKLWVIPTVGRPCRTTFVSAPAQLPSSITLTPTMG